MSPNLTILEMLISIVAVAAFVGAAYQARKVHKYKRMHAAISGSNRALTESESVDELLARVCHTLVHNGGFSSALLQNQDGEIVAQEGNWDLPLPDTNTIFELASIPVTKLKIFSSTFFPIRNRPKVTSIIAFHDPEETLVLHLCELGFTRWSDERTEMVKEIAGDLGFGYRLRKSNDAPQLIQQEKGEIDVTTGLYSLSGLIRLISEVEISDRAYAMVYIDIDHLDRLNDALGHARVDLLLFQLAERLKHSVKSTDICSRVGGDEFVVLVTNALDSSTTLATAQRLIKRLSHVYNIEGEDIKITLSAGVAIRQEGEQANDIKSRALHAMQDAKRHGRNRVALFDHERLDPFWRHLTSIESALSKAISNDELQVHLQPQINLITKDVVAYEALLRWEHPAFGKIPPNVFIPIAEETGDIVRIGLWVLDRCLEMLRQLPAHVRIAINVSPVQLMDEFFVDSFLYRLEQERSEAHRIELEITETAVMENLRLAVQKLQRLRDIGVSIAIDDFGVGNSSLSTLKEIPANRLKIDRSFIESISADNQDYALVRAIINMGKSMQMHVIAEGVEKAHQADLLEIAGCQEAQGWYFGKPVASETLFSSC